MAEQFKQYGLENNQAAVKAICISSVGDIKQLGEQTYQYHTNDHHIPFTACLDPVVGDYIMFNGKDRYIMLAGGYFEQYSPTVGKCINEH